MLRVLAAVVVTLVTVPSNPAQQAPDRQAPDRQIPDRPAPDWQPLVERLRDVEAVPPFGNDVPMDVRAWSTAVVEGVSAEDRARLFAEGLRRDDVGRAVAVVTLLAAAQREASTAAQVYRELIACHVLENVARSAEVSGNVTASRTPEWLKKVRPKARARGLTLLARMLREFPGDLHAARAIAQGALGLVDEPKVALDVEAAARQAALQQLGDDARAEDYTALFGLQLERRDLDGARAALARARKARPPFDLARRERLLESFELAEATLARVAALERRLAAGDDAPLVRLQLACAIAADDVEQRCRALVADGFEHALPDTVLALRALAAGRRDDAVAHTERARSLPGGDEGVAVLVAMLQWPQLQQKLLQAPGDDATALEVEKLLAEMDELLGEGDSAAVTMLRGLRDAGWPQVPQQQVTRHLAEVYGGQQRAPTSAAEYSLAMAGVLAGLVEGGGDVAPALRFLQVPVAEPLAQRPLLMRQRAACATTVAVWADMHDASAEVLAEARRLSQAARDRSRGLDDGAFAGYLDAVEAWVAADGEAAQRAVLASLRLLDGSPVQSGAWLPGSAPMVLGSALDGSFDRDAFVALRVVTGQARKPVSLIPLAVAGMVREPEASRQMTEYLRSAVTDGRGRNVLAVAEIEGGAAPAVAAARARQVLASDDWSDDEARELQHGVWLRFRLDWGLNYNSRGPQLDVALTCEPVLLPKLPSATKLDRYVRRR
jgi:hypothetical protein